MEQLLDNAEALGPLVRARRHELGVTQIELADIARTGVRFISDLETGKRSVRLETVLKVLDALGLELVARTR
ncbi:MAG TPA: type II toxin-antitoxin system Y4mF family antitoxin [Solirubrobacterales bacterium]|nr:type II toxin-antitoxin system Y4mF family antitoxin [Solirubrobacterales bacterium]